MKRGDIVLMAGRGDFSGKPRPSLVVQSDIFNEWAPGLIVCPITSQATGNSLFRVAVPATEQSGLLVPSEVQVDKVQALRRTRAGRRIGRAPEAAMLAVDAALRRWLDL